MMQDHLTLKQLNKQVKHVLHDQFSAPVWVIAEISELRVNSSGHCYLELIEKDEEEDKVIARGRGMIWSFTYRILEPYFRTATGSDLTEGMKVLVSVLVEYHEIYGLSLNIRDIDPAYTIGDIAKRRQEVINRLEQEGVIDMNKELELPQVIENVAIISSKTAAGFGDFIDQLTGNEFGYQFKFKFYEAVMQGDHAAQSIIKALDAIFEDENQIDVVVIIRGGGAKADLFCFDDYWLAYHITQFPIPVLTGIGHERDDTITDMVSFENLKTPTAVAEFIIEHNYRFEQQLIEYEELISNSVNSLLLDEAARLEKFANAIPYHAKNRLNKSKFIIERLGYGLHQAVQSNFHLQERKLEGLKNRLLSSAKTKISKEDFQLSMQKKQLKTRSKQIVGVQQSKIDYFNSIVENLDPQNILERGYTLVEQKKKIIGSHKSLNMNDDLQIVFHDGKVHASIKKET